MKLQHEQIQYVEFLSPDLNKIKQFYSQAFDWQFTDFGPEYVGFESEYVDGGFALGEVVQGSVLVIVYSAQLEDTKAKVLAAGGELTKDSFSFPGGRRFQFRDIDGNELAVWSEK